MSFRISKATVRFKNKNCKAIVHKKLAYKVYLNRVCMKSKIAPQFSLIHYHKQWVKYIKLIHYMREKLE